MNPLKTIKFARKLSGGASRETVLAAAAWSLCSVGMTLVNKLAVTATRAPMGVVLIQMATTAAAAALTCNVHLGDGWQRWALTVPALFVIMMLTSMVALKYVSVGTFVVVRNLGPLFTLLFEVAVHRPDALHCDARTLGSLVTVVAGVVLYEWNDLQFSGLGVMFLLLNLLFACTERLVQRHLLAVSAVDVSKPGLMLLNNGIGLPLTVVAAGFVKHEYARTLHALAKPRQLLLVLLSALVGIGISYTGLWLQKLVTATSFMVLGASCKIALMVVGIAFLHDARSPLAILGALLSLGGCVLYATRPKPPEQAPLGAYAPPPPLRK